MYHSFKIALLSGEEWHILSKWCLSLLGEWEQALSRKDKKNRKKDDPLAADDAGPENIGNTDFYT